jgi:hypothetical protein
MKTDNHVNKIIKEIQIDKDLVTITAKGTKLLKNRNNNESQNNNQRTNNRNNYQNRGGYDNRDNRGNSYYDNRGNSNSNYNKYQ